MDLRQQIAEAVHFAHAAHYGCAHCTRTAAAVMAVVQPALDAKDAENARLREDLAEANHLVGTYMAAAQVADHQRKRAERAEAERDRLRARLTGVAIHANRLANCIWPDTPAWAALADLRAAVDQPDQEGTRQ